MKKILFAIIIVVSLAQCSQYLNQGKQNELGRRENNARPDQDAPIIVGFESEPIVDEDDPEGASHVFSSTQSQKIIFRKYFHHWNEEPRFRHPITKNLTHNVPILNVLVQDTDSRPEDIALNFRVVRTSLPSWSSHWQRAVLTQAPYKGNYFQVLLSSRTLGYPVCRAGTNDYELELQAEDKGGHSSDTMNIPFRVENLKAPMKTEVDLGFQSQRKLSNKSLWGANLKNIFTPGKLLPTDNPLIIKRYKIFSSIDVDTYLKVYPQFQVFYKLESHYIDTSLMSPEPLLAQVLSRNKLQSHIVMSKMHGEEIEPLTEPMKWDEKTHKHYFEIKLKKGESLVFDVQTGFQYEDTPTQHVFNHGRNNLAYHTVEIEPQLTLEALPYPNDGEYLIYREESNNWNFLEHREKESVIYVQKTSI